MLPSLMASKARVLTTSWVIVGNGTIPFTIDHNFFALNIYVNL